MSGSVAGGVDRGGGGVDGLSHHVQGREGVERCCGGSVFVAEEAHDDRQRDALLVEVHGFGFAQHVAVDVLRDRGALSAGGFGGLLEHGGDGVGGQFCQVARGAGCRTPAGSRGVWSMFGWNSSR